MITDLSNYDIFSREHWQHFHQATLPLLTQEELDRIKSLNDKIDMLDVEQVYLPLVSLIQIYKHHLENLAFSKGIFLQKEAFKRPFIIGISGSVAVGKSTTSRLLQLLLSGTFPDSQVEMVTTDGFLFPNAVLESRQQLNRKGFPESYNMELLLDFLERMKKGESATIPIYSHDIYDIIPDKKQTIHAPDFLIIEGINVFQNPQNQQLYISDYFDFSIYIDADSQHIETWYLERFQTLLNLARTDKNNYYHKFTKLPKSEALAFAKTIWQTINLVNLTDYIKPTRNRAEVILHKSKSHQIDYIYVKR